MFWALIGYDWAIAVGLAKNIQTLQRSSLFVRRFLFFNGHILKFTGLENIAAFKAFHIFGLIFTGGDAGDDAHTRVLALFGIDIRLRRFGRLAGRHKLANIFISRPGIGTLALNWRYFAATSDRCQVPVSFLS